MSGNIQIVARGRRLEYTTLAWNALEAAAAIWFAVGAGSMALLGFGLDSVVELASGAILLWRLRAEPHPTRALHPNEPAPGPPHSPSVGAPDEPDFGSLGRFGEGGDRTPGSLGATARAERIAVRLVGVCFLLLAAFVALGAALELIRPAGQSFAETDSMAGIAVTVVSFAVMTWLSRAKRRVGRELNSGAMQADARQSEFCACLSLLALMGLAARTGLGWRWADPAAALMMVPVICRDGIRGVRGESCGCTAVCGTTCSGGGSAPAQFGSRL